MSDIFTRNLFRWLNQVSADREITPGAFRLAYILSQHFNRRTGNAWPTQETLAKASRLTRRGVQMCLDALETQGHLRVIAGRGRGNVSTYEPILRSDDKAIQRANSSSPFDDENANLAAPFEDEKREPQFALSDAKRRTKTQKKANETTKKGEVPFAQNHLNNHLKEPSEGERLSPPPSIGEKKPSKKGKPATARSAIKRDNLEGFNSFWAAYPKRVAKVSAQRAYDKALDTGATPAELLAGAERFAAERALEPDPAKRERFTPHATSWLNAGRWADEPSAAPFQSAEQRQDGGRQARPSMFDLAFRGRLPE